MCLPVGGVKGDPAPSLTHLEELRQTLGMALEERRKNLTQAQQLQLFREQADHADMWLASNKEFLHNNDLGVSKYDTVQCFDPKKKCVMEFQSFTHQKILWVSHENKQDFRCCSVCNVYRIAPPPP